MRKLNIIGTGISATSYEEIVDVLGNWLSGDASARESRAKYICVTSVHGIVTARHDAEFRSVLNGADVATPDGMPVVCLPLLCGELKTRYPELTIVGTYSPPFRPLTTAEDEHVKQMIRASGADLVFVGIGTPKQEKWMAAHQWDFPGKVLIGVGAAFDFHAKRVRQAPSWMQSAGLEWFFRLLVEPARLWRRYLLITPQFLPLWALQKMGILRYDAGRAG